MLNKLFFFILTFLSFILINGCQDFSELDEVEIKESEREFAVPILSSTINIEDVVGKLDKVSQIYIDENGLVILRYEGEVLTQGADVIIENIQSQIITGIPIPLEDETTVLPFGVSEELEFDLVRFKEGKIFYTYQAQTSDQVTVTVTFPNIKLDGQVLQYTKTSADTDLFSNNNEAPSLANYELTPEDDGTIIVNYTAVDANGDDVDLAGIGVVLGDNTSFSYLEGYLGDQTNDNDPGVIPIDIFDKFVRGSIWFEEPSITMSIENSFGFPVSSFSEYFRVLTVNGDTLALRNEDLGPNLRVDFNYPSFQEIGQSKVTNFVFNNMNSNIDTIIGAGPIAIEYDVDAVTNPDLETNIRGFMTDSSFYKVNLKAELPLYGSAADFNVQDTFDFKFGDFEEMREGELKIISENQLPLKVRIQGYFLDDSDQIIDSLFNSQEQLIDSGMVDAITGEVLQTTEVVTFVDIENQRINNIMNKAKKIIIRSSFTTGQDGSASIKILSTQQLKVRMGIKFKID